MKALAGGAVAGTAATAVMSAWMVVAERMGVMRGQPPREVVDRLARVPDGPAADGLAVVSHLAYGAAAGAVFAASPLSDRARPAAGVGYGLALWAVGYEGWLPVLGVLPAAHRDRRGRVVTMVVAHALYGAVLGVLSRGSSSG